MFGGNDGASKNDLWWYDPVDGTWTEKIAQGDSGSPSARGFHSMVWDGTRGIMFGGNDGAFKNDLWRYDPVSNTWTGPIISSGSPSARTWHSMVSDVTSERVIMFGGSDGAVKNDLWWWW
jgi:N-acetylneuraminic acid mutarotase